MIQFRMPDAERYRDVFSGGITERKRKYSASIDDEDPPAQMPGEMLQVNAGSYKLRAPLGGVELIFYTDNRACMGEATFGYVSGASKRVRDILSGIVLTGTRAIKTRTLNTRFEYLGVQNWPIFIADLEPKENCFIFYFGENGSPKIRMDSEDSFREGLSQFFTALNIVTNAFIPAGKKSKTQEEITYQVELSIARED